MRGHLCIAFAAIASAALLGACSDGTDTSLEKRPTTAGDGTVSDPRSGGGSTAGTSAETPGASKQADPTKPGGSTPPPTTAPAPNLPPPPVSGPGSAGAPGRMFFEANVYTKLALCGACHNTGLNGAPRLLGPTASEAYQALDVRGLIAPDSLLLTQGVHFNGAGPAMPADSAAVVTTWLGMEAKERAGTPAAVNVFDKIGGCFTAADYEPVRTAIDAVRTQARNGENQNQCTGCRQTPCRDCHAQGEYGFRANNQVLQPAATYFAQWVTDDAFIKTFIGTNGADIVPSPKLTSKADAVKTGKPYSHPLFTLPANLTNAITTFATNAITKFNAKQCGQ